MKCCGTLAEQNKVDIWFLIARNFVCSRMTLDTFLPWSSWMTKALSASTSETWCWWLVMVYIHWIIYCKTVDDDKVLKATFCTFTLPSLAENTGNKDDFNKIKPFEQSEYYLNFCLDPFVNNQDKIRINSERLWTDYILLASSKRSRSLLCNDVFCFINCRYFRHFPWSSFGIFVNWIFN